MSVFYDKECDKLIDSDLQECYTDPRESTELLCESCYQQIDYEYSAKLEGMKRDRV